MCDVIALRILGIIVQQLTINSLLFRGICDWSIR